MIQVKGFRIIVKPDEVVKETDSGIVLATDEKLEKTGIQRGILVAVGDQAWSAYRNVDENGNEVNGRPWAQPGDYVLFAKWSGRFVYDPFEPEEDKQNEYLIMNDDDILAVLKEGENPVFDNSAKKAAKRMLV